ncbi:hypothetical protein GNI_068790 [Gregarina niphandrodes]|uniref:Uncharacterized protein n=1 Tax=Gregarina niphandrodes TaxID=110365 RepID=A0A023B7G6_GRENI|nr:hypothetical protein GNI_068790 [Gregarina niphandrodes]EZG67404.1 hypothetical protein GNI_068790 [Gregarina niphandrodes]|eukprot:XP_011130237.1 hypothetical protein GNI_068790 [Gregarina niphandrodes]
MTWAPVPSCVESTWIYELEVCVGAKLRPRQSDQDSRPRSEHGGEGRGGEGRCVRGGSPVRGGTPRSDYQHRRSETRTESVGRPDSGRSEGGRSEGKWEWTIDCTEEASYNVSKYEEDLAFDQRRNGFSIFLWDVIAFWRGLYSSLERRMEKWVPPNEDMSLLVSSVLRRDLGLGYVDALIGFIPLMEVVLNAWRHGNHWSRIKAFNDLTADSSSTGSGTMMLHIPAKLRTVKYKLIDLKKELILYYGYQLQSTEDANTYTFGISNGGVLSSSVLSVMKEEHEFVYEVDEAFVLNTPYNGIIFEALIGTEIEAKYDDVFPKFYNMYMSAIQEYPRNLFERKYLHRKQRIVFSFKAPGLCQCEQGRCNCGRCTGRAPDKFGATRRGYDDLISPTYDSPSARSRISSGGSSHMSGLCGPYSGNVLTRFAVEVHATVNLQPLRNEGLWTLLQELNNEGGMFILRAKKQNMYISYQHNGGPFINGNTQWRKSRRINIWKCIGRIKSRLQFDDDLDEPRPRPPCSGRYKIRDLLATNYDQSRASFLNLFCRNDDNEIELHTDEDDNYRLDEMTDVHCLQIEPGTQIQVIKIPAPPLNTNHTYCPKTTPSAISTTDSATPEQCVIADATYAEMKQAQCVQAQCVQAQLRTHT